VAEAEVLEVRAETKDGVTNRPPNALNPLLCLHCQARPARRFYCSGACRQAAYRNSRSHRANLDAQIAFRTWRRNRWNKEKVRDKSLGFDARFAGPERKGIPKIGQFGRWGDYQPDIAEVVSELIDEERKQVRLAEVLDEIEKRNRYATVEARIKATAKNSKQEQSCNKI
jgi:hypothetical protein